MGSRGNEVVEASHLLFSNDTLVLCEACNDQLVILVEFMG